AHADTLQVLLWLDGQAMLIDPGMPTFFEIPAARDRFRATAVHNTLTIGGQDQSQMLGPFLWGKRASIIDRRWEPAAATPSIEASHDGYLRTPFAAVHRRRVTLIPGAGAGADESIEVVDVIDAPAAVPFEVVWQFHPECRVDPAGAGDSEWVVRRGRLQMRMRIEAAGALAKVEQGEISARFGQTQPAPRLVVGGMGKGSVCRSVVLTDAASEVEGKVMP
ncbi:MAG: heparinase II/III-family protein, partial [Planctomycetota bacterium]|nr:heparinase II/III-family protein [Planctomycetota bacterium]